jgi:hypothetical protein
MQASASFREKGLSASGSRGAVGVHDGPGRRRAASDALPPTDYISSAGQQMKGETPVRAQVGAGRPQGRAKPAAANRRLLWPLRRRR